MLVANFSMPVLLYFGNFSASKFHINIMEEFTKDLLAGVSFLIILLPKGRINFKTKIKGFTKSRIVPKMLET